MSKKKRGLNKLIEVIWEKFCREHQEGAIFSCDETEGERGLYCFLGIDLHPEDAKITLSASLDNWDIYATCYVTDDDVILDKYKLPKIANL